MIGCTRAIRVYQLPAPLSQSRRECKEQHTRYSPLRHLTTLRSFPPLNTIYEAVFSETWASADWFPSGLAAYRPLFASCKELDWGDETGRVYDLAVCPWFDASNILLISEVFLFLFCAAEKTLRLLKAGETEVSSTVCNFFVLEERRCMCGI